MNLDEARQCLTTYWALLCQAQQQPWLSKERRATAKKINELLPAVNSILRALAPDITPINAYSISDHAAAGVRVRRALRLLDGSQEITSQQWTGGGPALPLSLLDPTVRDAALPLWTACKYRQAVNDAATSLTSYAQTRTGRHDISDKDLMAQLFSSDSPQRGKPRLRCPGNPASETVRSQQDGARAYAIGTYQAIRNPAHHLIGDWNPVTAAHHLVSLSQVAHWVRHWNIDRYVELPDPSKINNPAIAQMIKDMTQAQGQ